MQYKNLHLIISSLIVIPVAFVYGFIPEILFDVAIITTDEANIYKAIMGLYLGFGIFWILGIINPQLWQAATISNCIFMLGLGFGRILSFAFDGLPSTLLLLGGFGELILGIYGFTIIKKQKNKSSSISL